MYFNCHPKVLINGNQLNSIVSIESSNDSHNIGAFCDIIMPINARFIHEGKGLTAPARNIFNTGDYIIVKAKYDGYEKDANADSDGFVTFFTGFLFDFYLGVPLKIKCLDYIYWFNMGIFGNSDLVIKVTKTGKFKRAGAQDSIGDKTKAGKGYHKDKVKFKEVLQDLVDWVNYDITKWSIDNDVLIPLVELYDPIFDMDLVNITFNNMSPAAVLEYFKKELGLCITFLANKLYVNVASNTTKNVKLKTDINVLTSELQTTNLKNLRSKNVTGANSVFQKIKVKASFVRNNGTKDSVEVGDPNGQLREVFFYTVKQDEKLYEQLAKEALIKFYQARYNGEVSTLFYPHFDILWRVEYIDVRYPERNGFYVCTSMKVIINEHGYHRKAKLAAFYTVNTL